MQYISINPLNAARIYICGNFFYLIRGAHIYMRKVPLSLIFNLQYAEAGKVNRNPFPSNCNTCLWFLVKICCQLVKY